MRSFAQSFDDIDEACTKLKIVLQSLRTLEQGRNLQPVADVVQSIEEALDRAPYVKSSQNSRAKRDAKDVDDAAAKQVSRNKTCLTQPYMPAPEDEGNPREAFRRPAISTTNGTATASIDAQVAKAQSRTFDISNPRKGQIPGVHSSLKPSPSLHLPQMETIPYLRQAQHTQQTFAGNLFWSTLSLAYRLINCVDSTAAPHRMFSYYFQHGISRDIVAHRIKSRILLGCTDVVERDPRPDGELSLQLNEAVVEEMTRKGEQVQQYLDPREVELYLRRKWLDPDNIDLQGTTAPACSSWDRSSPRTGDVWATLTERLSREAVCFGDSPRYHVNDVETALSAAFAANSVSAGRQDLLPLASTLGDPTDYMA